MKKFRILLAAAVFAAVCACTEKATETEERFSFSGPGEINAPFKEYTATVSFRTNCAWKLEVPAEASDWISVNPASGDAASQVSMKRVAVRILANDGDGRRSAELVLTAGSKHRRTITVNQSSKSDLKSCRRLPSATICYSVRCLPRHRQPCSRASSSLPICPRCTSAS